MDEVVLVSNLYTVKIQKTGIGFLTDDTGIETYLNPRETENMVDAFNEDVALFDLVCGLKIVLRDFINERTSGLDGRA